MDEFVTREAASSAVTALGWRQVFNSLMVTVPARSLIDAHAVAALVVDAAGPDGDRHVRVDVRGDRVIVGVQSVPAGRATRRGIELAQAISAALTQAGRSVGDPARSVQVLEIAVDALDIAAVRPFWQAAFGYADDGHGSLFDPWGQGPSIWFQQMDGPRPQRNRIHFDVSVPHDEAAARIEATVAAGGRVIYDSEAPAFWVLADPEGNEVCICTWQGRD